MPRIVIIACDHCDCRDIEGQPPVRHIKDVAITIRIGDIAPQIYKDVMLCQSCQDRLKELVFQTITQEPSQA